MFILWAWFQKRSDHCDKVIRSVISRQLMISGSDWIPWTILFWSDHDPGDPARYMDQCWTENSSEQLVILSAISPKSESTNYQETFTRTCSVLCEQYCRYSMMLTTYTYLSNMACPNRVVLWTIPCACTELAVMFSVWAHINDIATPPNMTSRMNVISLTFLIQPRSHSFGS